jgi:hypothetical protein
MQELFVSIKAWPVIVQGALGSGLFWLVLRIGQWLTNKASAKYSHISKEARLSWLINAQTKYEGASTDKELSHVASVSTLSYRAMRYLFRALQWMTLGLVIQSFVELPAVVGYIGCLYYLFKGYEVVAPIRAEDDTVAKLMKVNEEIESLKRN